MRIKIVILMALLAYVLAVFLLVLATMLTGEEDTNVSAATRVSATSYSGKSQPYMEAVPSCRSDEEVKVVNHLRHRDEEEPRICYSLQQLQLGDCRVQHLGGG